MRKETDSMIELKQIDEVSDDVYQGDKTEGMEQAGEMEEGEKKEERGKMGEVGETEQAAMAMKEFWQKIQNKTCHWATVCSMGEDNNPHNQAHRAFTSSSPKL